MLSRRNSTYGKKTTNNYLIDIKEYNIYIHIMDLIDKIVSLIPKEVDNIHVEHKNINIYNKFDLDKPSKLLYFDRMKYFGNHKQLISKLNEDEIPIMDDSYISDTPVDIECGYGSTSYEFFNTIHKNEYKNKVLFKFWEQYSSILNRAILKEYERELVKIRLGHNSFIIVPMIHSTSIHDYHSICFSNHITNNEIPVHFHILGSHLKFQKKNITFKYIPYTHHIEPKVLMMISDKERTLETNGGHTQLTIQPKGFYRFSDSYVRNPSNIQSIYFDVGDVVHTRKDLIIYEIKDELVDQRVIDQRINNYVLSSDIDQILQASPMLKSKSTKRNKIKKQKRLENNLILMNNKELNELIQAVVESDPIYESEEEASVIESEIESESESESEEEIVVVVKPVVAVKPIKKEPEIKLHFLPNVENTKFISKVIHNAIEKKSKFYDLVKDVSIIYIVNGLHNSFHKTEKYNHFNLKLAKEHITYHVYVNDDRILYFTELVYNYD